jgi:hypothetical protein
MPKVRLARLATFTAAAFNSFNSFTCLLFTRRNSLYRHGATLFMVEEFPPLDGRFSLLRRKEFPSYRGRISPSIVEGIL